LYAVVVAQGGEAEDGAGKRIGLGGTSPLFSQALGVQKGAMSILSRRTALLLPALSPALIAARAVAATEAGRVAELRGAATAEGPMRRPLAVGAPIFQGDRIATAAEARCTLQLGPALTVRLGGAVRLTLDRFLLASGGVLVLEQGALLVDRAGGPQLALRGPFGLIAVRGTRFWGGPDEGNFFGVFVERGRVLLANANQAVELNPGEGAGLPGPGAPPEAPARWSEARIAALRALVD
jgi:hypothetical protein